MTKKCAKTNIKSPFLPEGQKQGLGLGRSPPQEVEEGPRSGPHLLVYINIIVIPGHERFRSLYRRPRLLSEPYPYADTEITDTLGDPLMSQIRAKTLVCTWLLSLGMRGLGRSTRGPACSLLHDSRNFRVGELEKTCRRGVRSDRTGASSWTVAWQ